MIGGYYILLHCTQCNWVEDFYRASDVIMPNDELPPDTCPCCGNQELHAEHFFGKDKNAVLIKKLWLKTTNLLK